MFNDKIWSTQNNKPNVAIIWMDLSDNILEIEGYDIATTVSPYPSKMFIVRGDLQSQTFVFASSRSNSPSDKQGGLYITFFDDPANVFKQRYSCDPCKTCSGQLTSQCTECNSGWFLFKQKCYFGGCPEGSYPLYDASGAQLSTCGECHYTCLNCTGPTKFQCTACCMDDYCGPIYNRVPNMGMCQCAAGLADANGICEPRCILNLKGKRQNFCYPVCPANSFPLLQYDQATPQERSQFDTSSQTDCKVSSNHLQFKTTKKGLAVLGPPNLNAIPSELTVAFWVRPTALNSISYFVNVFNRVQVYASSSNSYAYFVYKTTSSSSIQPTYSATPANRQVTLNSWNYISVAIRKKSILNIMRYEMQMALANSNLGTVNNAGYDNSQVYIVNPYFQNNIYLGAFSDMSPQSFSGILKEFKVFMKYHGFAQMQDERLRLYRYYSYDDPNLISYWKLNETYSATDLSYTINDYSQYENQLTYSIPSNPDYPVFTYDNSIALSLCIFHDVALCQSVEYEETTAPIVMASKDLTQAPTFLLNDFQLTKADGDQLWYVNNNTLCLQQNILAYMTYRAGFTNKFVIEDTTMNPVDLLEGTHYQACYAIASLNVSFNLYQVYLMQMPLTVDPSSRTAFITPSVFRTWMTTEGDSAYGDIIQFSEDCGYPEYDDFKMVRSNKPDYGKHEMTEFKKAGNFYFCYQPVFVQDQFVPYLSPIHDLKYTIISNPNVADSTQQSVAVNENIIQFEMDGAFTDGDLMAFAWQGKVAADCNPLNFLGQTFLRNYSYFPSVWFGVNSGVYGVKNVSMDEIQMCYKSNAEDAPNSWFRVKKNSGTIFFLKVFEYNFAKNAKLPELLSFYPGYGSTELYEQDTMITFSFLSQTVYPSRQSDGPPIVYGWLKIFRGAIKEDGSIIKTGTVLWQMTTLNDFATPNAFQQGDLLCTQSGQCSIILSQQSSRIKAGEIYFLSFYPKSFAAKPSPGSTTRYYLFDDLVLPTGQTSAYDHLFFCRSFDIYSSTSMVNGKVLTVYGVDMQSKQIFSKEVQGSIASDTFTTKAINLVLTIQNTVNPSCTAVPPTATVKIADIQQTSFTIRNLNLRDCNEGDLFADISLVRGIRNQYGDFTYLREEWIKNIQLGAIGCHNSCLSCNGTTSENCNICANEDMFMFQGTCSYSCPANAPYFTISSIVFQRQPYVQQICQSVCPFGMYPDLQTSQCLACNPDCQSCNSSLIASCISCNPVKYLFGGKCLFDCPSPHHANNFSDYTCTQISSPTVLSVKIQSLGYKSKIPKNQQSYLKAYINNKNGGEILSIQWEQLEPLATSPQINIFTLDDDGNQISNVAVIKLRMSAFNYMSTSQVVKIQCTVTNSIGDVAYDIYEFYLNSPPTLGNQTLSMLNSSKLPNLITINTTDNGTAPFQTYIMNLDGWGFNGKSSAYKIYMKVDSVYYLVTDYFSTNSTYFRFPSLSMTESKKNISVCVNALDEFAGEASQCSVLFNIKNNLTYIQNYTILLSFAQTLPILGNMTNVVQIAQMLNFAIKTPLRNPGFSGICQLDVHCSNQGECDSQLGIERCICNPGYAGTHCQLPVKQMIAFQNITRSMIMTLFLRVTSEFEIYARDIELVGTVLRGVLKDPDMIGDADFGLCIQLVEMIGNASIYAHFPLTQDVREVYLDAMSLVMAKLSLSYKIQRTLPFELQQLQLNPDANLSSSRMLFSSIVSDEYPLLIGGKKQKEGTKGRELQSQLLPMTGITYKSIEEQYEAWERKVDFGLNQFISMFIQKLNPMNPLFVYATPSFELYTSSNYASAFKSKQVFIKEKDVYWNIPSGIFDNAQGDASDNQEVRFLLMKYLVNPFQFEQSPGAFVESNVTTISFYNTNNDKLEIELLGTNTLEIRQPWTKVDGYNQELLRCMYWDEQGHSFVANNNCSFNLIYDNIPCLTCAEGEYINTSLALCRCVHLSRYALVYEQSSPSSGQGNRVGVYSDFFAMQYWQTSFGYFAVLACMTLFFSGHLILFFVDLKLQPKVVARLRERARKMELKGFKQRERDLNALDNHSKAMIGQKFPSIFNKKNQKGPMKDDENSSPVTKLQRGESNDISVSPQFKKVDKLGGKKKFEKKKKGKGDQVDSDRSSLVPLNSLNKKQTKGKNKDDPLAETGKNMLEKENLNNQIEEEEKEDFDSLRQQVDGVPERNEEEYENQMRKKLEEEKNGYNQAQKNLDDPDSDDMDQYNHDQKKFLDKEKKEKEKSTFQLKRLLINGNYATSIMFVTSILSPRHARWTLLTACICLNWFWCAVIYNNTKSPLVLPDLNKSSYNIDASDLWVSFVSPFGTLILMYIFAGLFKISDSRLKNSYTTIYLEHMLVELRKEMRLRFILAYFITVSIFSAVFWYTIKFTATFGWKVSWTWWYSGIYAIIIQFCFVDPIVSLLHWITYYCSRQLALFCMKLRVLKQARTEA